MHKSFVRLMMAVVIVATIVLGAFDFTVVAAQEACGYANATVAGVGDATIELRQEPRPEADSVFPDGGAAAYRLIEGGEWHVQSSEEDNWYFICSPTDAQAKGYAPKGLFELIEVQPEATPEPVADAIVDGATLDDDTGTCEHEECSWDIGVNKYDPELSQTAQIGFIWGAIVSWGPEIGEENEHFAILADDWYLDATTSQGGGVRVYNYPASWTPEQLQALTLQVANEVLPPLGLTVPAFADIPVWNSDVPSYSGSAQGSVAEGPGDNYPQVDGQQFSCYPQMGDCPVNVTVAEERQIGLVFGVQINSGALQGQQSDDPEESRRNPQFRCEIVVLSLGSHSLVMSDARVEVYNVPAFDQEGWFRNLVGERAAEQAMHYECPQHEVVPIWNADGTSTMEYTLRWTQNDDGTLRARAGGPDEIVAASE